MKTIKEYSPQRICWDLLIILLVMATWVVVPFQAAFRHAPAGSNKLLILFIDLFFWIDIYLNFFTSYRHQGQDVIDPSKTIVRYRNTFFAFDLVANIPYELLFLFWHDFMVLGIPIVMALRFVRLLRIVRFFVVFRRWERFALMNPGYLRIVKFLVAALLLIHCIACLWFLQAHATGFPVDSWVVRQGLRDKGAFAQYVRSLYWTISTMTTVGYGDITPHDMVEYLFTCVTMLIGASVYAFIIGNVAALFSNLDTHKAGYWRRTEAVTLFLRTRHVPTGLLEQIRSYYEYIWERRQGWRKADFLDDLPGPLKLRVMSALAEDLLQNLSLFKHCSPHLRKELLVALKPQTHAPDMTLVQAGELGREIFFITQGTMEIISADGNQSYGKLEAGDFFGAFSLILEEKRSVSVVTRTYCEVFILEKADFYKIKNEYPEFTEVLRKISNEKSEVNSALVLDGAIL